MFVTITNDHDGEVIYQRKLEDDELLDPVIYAKDYLEWADLDVELDMDGHVPLGCGDFTVELAEHPGTGVCWTAQSFFASTY